MMTVPGRVSVGICTLNRREFAMRAVRAALDQTYRDVEVIVSDDASTDDTVQWISRIEDPRLKFFQQKARLGVIGNSDFCLRQATGEFWMFVGDDDFLLPTAIEKLVAPFLEQQQDLGSVGATWCPCLVADADGEAFWTTEGGPPCERVSSMLAQLWAGNRGPRCSSILLRSKDAMAVGGYDPKYGALSDIGNWARAAILSDRMVCINEALVQYTVHQGNMTAQASVEQWQKEAALVHADLVAMAHARGDAQAERELKSARSSCISSITLTVLSLRVGRPGWIRDFFLQALRTPGAIFTRYMLHRLAKDGKKVFTLFRRAQQLQVRLKSADPVS